MKILRKGDVFSKMNDSSLKDIKQIDSMISSGWKFSPKKDYKTYLNGGKSVEKVETTDEVKPVEKVKKVKESKKKK